MIAQTNTLEDLRAQIARMSTIDESSQVRQAMADSKVHAPAEVYEQVRRALSKRMNEIAEQGERELAETADLLRVNGMTYDLGEWLTIANYAKKYSVDSHVVTNWIRRQVIPADCIVEIAPLNNIRMVKDRPYRQ